MAHHKSALKRIITSEKAHQRNKSNRSFMRGAIKNWTAELESNPEAAEAGFPKLMKTIFATASKGALKKQTAARRVSRLAKALNRAKTEQKEA